MKKLLIIIIGVIFLAGCNLQPPFGGGEKTLQEKYNLSEVKNKYQLEGTTLKRAVKDNPKDVVRVEIGEQLLGGDGDATIEPKLTISRWDEVSFSIKPKNYDKVLLKDKAVKFDGDKTVFETPKENYLLYEMPISEENPEGAFEYQIDLKEKPASNKIEFTLETQGLDFFYQPELTQKEIDEGASRPENVVGSYAVYAKTPKTNWTGGKEYKVGKVGHIFRPKIIDSLGTEVWGDLHIENGILSVTIPQEFLDKAVYPVRHAAGLTFGYDTEGSAYFNFSFYGYGYHVSILMGNPWTGAAGTLDSITAYLYGSTSGLSADTFVALYEENSEGSGSHGKVALIETANLSYGVYATPLTPTTFTASDEVLSAVNYIIAICGNGDDLLTGGNPGDTLFIKGDATSSTKYTVNAGFGDGKTYATIKAYDPLVDAAETISQRYSIYATYSVAASPATTVPNSDIIIF
ncbi:MAG: hypothetical protein WCW93_03790, partial [Candidatus Paceibacterota bacterium]